MTKEYKYPFNVYKDVQDYYRENGGIELSIEEVENNLTRYEVLEAFLKWNGIFGYTFYIAEITNLQ